MNGPGSCRLLMRIHAWKLVTRRELRPTDQEEAKDWEKRAEKATGEIFLRLDSANRDAVVDDLDNPVHMWEKLQRHHEDKSSLGRFNAYEDLFNVRKRDDESMEELIGRVSTLMRRIQNSRPSAFTLQDFQSSSALSCSARPNNVRSPQNKHIYSSVLLMLSSRQKARRW